MPSGKARAGRVPPSGVNPEREPQRVIVIMGVVYEASKAGGVEAGPEGSPAARMAAIDASER
jgi:hypothetical protein